MTNKLIDFQYLGTEKDYQEVWDYQEKLLNEIVSIKIKNRDSDQNLIEKLPKTPNYLLMLEHSHVFTLGKNGNESNLLANPVQLEKLQVKFVKTNRGGDITYHGPGQLVMYPILDLGNFKEDLVWYLRTLEEVAIQVLAEFGINGSRSQGETGVWLDVGTPFARKIAAIGVKTSHWVCMHGLSLNVNPDMRYFETIIPCGIKDKHVTSIYRETGIDFPMTEIVDLMKNKFADLFESEFKPVGKLLI